MQRALVRPAVPPPGARRPRSGRIVSRMGINTTTVTTPPTTHVICGTDDATAPRSDRGGRRYRGSRVLVALAPATHGYFLRPLRGRTPLSGLYRPFLDDTRITPWALVPSRLRPSSDATRAESPREQFSLLNPVVMPRRWRADIKRRTGPSAGKDRRPLETGTSCESPPSS